MRFSFVVAPFTLALCGLIAGCSSNSAASDEDEGAFTSNQATLLTFEFDGELLADSGSWDPVQDHLLYTVGHLNANNSVGRLDTVQISNLDRSTEGDKMKVKYHVKMDVAWGSKRNLPTSYEFTLPKDISSAGQNAFTEKYKHSCVDSGAHDLNAGSMWYYYRPHNSGCTVDAADSIKTTARVSKSPENRKDTYPEYKMIWADKRLEVISIFGKFEENGGDWDAGVSAYNTFVSNMRQQLGRLQDLKVTPADAGDRPGVNHPEVTFEAKMADGKQVKITALLVPSITNPGENFPTHYKELTPTADLIAYNGHSGLGQNVRALSQMGSWKEKQYQVFFMNGCDSFFYVDGTLARERARLNPEDQSGTKYMEFVTNAMPSFFSSMADASTAIVKGFLNVEAPPAYDKIFEGIDRAEVVLVTGEEDNTYRPGVPLGEP